MEGRGSFMKRRQFTRLFSITLLVLVAPKIEAVTKLKKKCFEGTKKYIILDGWILKGSDLNDI